MVNKLPYQIIKQLMNNSGQVAITALHMSKSHNYNLGRTIVSLSNPNIFYISTDLSNLMPKVSHGYSWVLLSRSVTKKDRDNGNNCDPVCRTDTTGDDLCVKSDGVLCQNEPNKGFSGYEICFVTISIPDTILEKAE